MGSREFTSFVGFALGSFLTPRCLLSDDQVLFVVIDEPKMRRLASRLAYTRIDDTGVVQFAEDFVT